MTHWIRLALGLALAALIAGCASPTPRQALKPGQLAPGQAITLVQPPEVQRYFFNAPHPGMAFGLIGGLIAGAHFEQRATELMAMTRSERVVPHESLAQALKSELEAAGHPVRVVTLPWIDKGGLPVPDLQRLGAGHERVLAVNAPLVGFMTDGVTGNYFPVVRARVALYGADRNRLLYDGHHTTGPVKSGEGWTQLPLVGQGFRSYEALTAQPALTAGAMREALALVARSAARDLQGPAGASRPVVAAGQPTPAAVAALAGEWSGSVKCGPFQGTGRVDNPDGWRVPARMTLSGSVATLVRGNASYTETLSGQVEPDLQLVLSGHGAMHATPDLPWATQFAGRFVPDRQQFGGKGTLVDRQGRVMRHCTVDLVRGGSRPA